MLNSILINLVQAHFIGQDMLSSDLVARYNRHLDLM